LILFVLGTNAMAPGSRLIEFNETHRVWMAPADVERIIVDPAVHFMDVTDFQKVSARPARANAFPDQPQHVAFVLEQIAQFLPASTETNIRTNLINFGNFHTRYFRSDTGRQAAEWLHNLITGITSGRGDIAVTYFTHSNFPQRSIIVRIEGTGYKSTEVVVVGAHLDSVGSTTAGRSPGHDDDGSGTMCSLEVLRALVRSSFRPERSIEFHYYAAEEGGLLGSQDISATYLTRGIDVISMLQLDMTMFGGVNTPVGVITDHTSPRMQTFMRLVLNAYADLNMANSQCGYGCSDHAPWTQRGFDASFIFETPFGQHNSRIHTANDLIDNANGTPYLSTARGLEFAKMALGYAIEMSFQ